MRTQVTGWTRTAGFVRGVWLFSLCLFLAGTARAFPLPVSPQTAVQAARLALLTQSQGVGEPPSSLPGQIVRLLSVGVVLTADGTIWQYTPDQQRWLTIDESFRLRKKETRILPLPVPLRSIQEMETYGFLLTDMGDCWLYNMATDSWEKLPVPRR